MPPAPVQHDLRGRPLDAKGRPLDAHGRPLDGMDRPLVNRVIEPVTRLAVPGYPNITIAFPSFGDWQAMYDPRNNRGAVLNQETFLEFRRRHERTMLKALAEIAARRSGQCSWRSPCQHVVQHHHPADGFRLQPQEMGQISQKRH